MHIEKTVFLLKYLNLAKYESENNFVESSIIM